MSVGTVLLVAVRDDHGVICDFRAEVVSPAVARIAGGRAVGDIVGRRLLEVLPGMVPSGLFAELVRCVEDAEPWSGDVPYPRDGVAGHFHVHAVGVGETLVLTVSDVQAQRRAEASEAEARTRLQAAMDVSVGALKILEAVRDEAGAIVDMRIVDTSAAIETVARRRRAEVTGRLLSEVYPPDRAGGVVAACAGVLETGEPYEVEAEPSALQPGSRWVHRRILRLGPDQVVMAATDVSERRMSEIALRRARERQAALLEAMQDGLVATDAAGVITAVNRAFARMTGLPRELLVGMGTPHPWWAPQDQQRLLDAYRTLRPGDRAELDLTLFATDGLRLEVTIAATALADDDGSVAGHVGTVRDVTRRMRAEAELRAGRAAYRALSDRSPDAIARFDREGRHVYVNPAWCHATGLAAEEALGRRVEELRGIPPDVLGLWAHEGHQALHSGVEREYEFSLPGPTGQRWYQTRLVPEHDDGEGGEVSHVIAVARDITARREEEAELRRERDRRAALIETMQDGVVAVEADTLEITEVNQRLLELTGFRRHALLGTRPPYPFWPEEELPHLLPSFGQVRLQGAGEFDQVWAHRDGDRFPVIVAAAAVLDDQGRITGYILTVKDSTLRRRHEQELRRSREAYRALAESLPDALLRVGTDLRCELLNGVAAEIAGLPAEAAIGASLADLGLAGLEDACRAALLTGAGREVLLDLGTPEAPWRMLCLVVPESPAAERVGRGVLVILRDAAGSAPLRIAESLHLMLPPPSATEGPHPA